jgi:Flp pilus assembly protein TadD
LAKPQIVTLPFVLLLWDYWPLQRMGAGFAAATSSNAPTPVSTPRSFYFLVREKLPLFVLAAADSIITIVAQRVDNAVRTISEVSLPDRLGNVFVSYVRYIGKAFWPTRLAPMYPRNPLPLWQVVGSAVLLLLLSLLMLRWRERRYLVFGWFWFLGTLAPMIGIVAVGDQAMADRYVYISFIGLFVAVVWSLDAWTQYAASTGHSISDVWRGAAAAVVVLILGSLTYRQIGYWRDDDTLWRYTLTVTDRNYVAHNNLALMLAGAGRSEEAVAEFRMAKSLHKYPPDQVLKLASYELRVGHPQEAIEECDSAMHSSNDPNTQAIAWIGIGQARLQLHRYDQAEQSYQNALGLSPDNSAALIGSGVLAMRTEQFDIAIAQLIHAVNVDPSDINFLLLSQALRQAGRSADANSAIAQAQKVSKDFSQAQIAAGQFLSLAGLKPQ